MSAIITRTAALTNITWSSKRQGRRAPRSRGGSPPKRAPKRLKPRGPARQRALISRSSVLDYCILKPACTGHLSAQSVTSLPRRPSTAATAAGPVAAWRCTAAGRRGGAAGPPAGPPGRRWAGGRRQGSCRARCGRPRRPARPPSPPRRCCPGRADRAGESRSPDARRASGGRQQRLARPPACSKLLAACSSFPHLALSPFSSALPNLPRPLRPTHIVTDS